MRLVLTVFLAAVALHGQDFYRKHNFTFYAGAGLPRAELRDVYASSAGVGFTYGYRFHPYFQVDGGYETLFGAGRVRDFLPTDFGNLRIRDYQQFVPFGGRVIVPVFGDRLQLQAGGGGAYFRYSERIRQPFGDSGFRIDCYECAVRDGVGYYGLAAVTVAVDRARMFRVGFGGKVYRGNTEGDPLGGVPSRQTTDRWVMLYGTVGVSF